MLLTHLNTIGGSKLFKERLAGVAVDAADRLLALADESVMVLKPDGTVDSQWEVGKVAWSLCPHKETIWVGMEGKLAAYSDNGETKTVIDDPQRLGMVTAVAVVNDQLWAADATHRKVHAYSLDGGWRQEIGAKVNTRGFMIPNGVLDLATDRSNGTVVIAHPQKHRVERFDAEGELVNKWGRFGMRDPADFGGCCNPTNIAASAKGVIAVSEKAPPRVKLHAATGELLTLTLDGVFDPNTKNIDLAFDSKNRLYATDPLKRTIEVFELSDDQSSDGHGSLS